MLPLFYLCRPCCFCHTLRCNHQDPPYFKIVKQQKPQCRKRDDRFAKSHVKDQTAHGMSDYKICCILLIIMCFVFHQGYLRSVRYYQLHKLESLTSQAPSFSSAEAVSASYPVLSVPRMPFSRPASGRCGQALHSYRVIRTLTPCLSAFSLLPSNVSLLYFLAKPDTSFADCGCHMPLTPIRAYIHELLFLSLFLILNWI